MIYSIVGTHIPIREKSLKKLAPLGRITQYIYSEQARELEQHIDANSLFEERTIVAVVQLGDIASSKDVLLELLPKMATSSTIFIIDEPFADASLSSTLAKNSKEFFDAKEEKIKDTSVFALCDSFAKRDKKQAWIQFMNLRTYESGEAIQGALWWKFQQLWGSARDGKKTAFTLPECERIGGDLVRSSIVAHRGERDLFTELERIILSL